MITSTKVRRRVIDKLLERCFRETETARRPANFSPDIQAFLQEVAPLAPGEDGLLACVLSRDYWCLISTERLLARQRAEQIDARWCDVIAGEPIAEEIGLVFHSKKPKDELETLLVALRGGRIVALSLGLDGAFFLIWNSIRRLASHDPEELGQLQRGEMGGIVWPQRER